MTRIADAQRRAGRFAGEDAESAWNDVHELREASTAARAPIGAPSIASQPPPSWKSRDEPPSPSGVEAGSTPELRVTDRGRRLPVGATFGDDQLSGLVARVFAAPPAGAGARCVLFCSAEHNPSPAVLPVIARRVRGAFPESRVAIVGAASPEASPAAVEDGIESFSFPGTHLLLRASELRAAFDFVLFHGSVRADVLPIAAAADGVVLLISENVTHREAAREAVKELQGSAAKLLGAVLTNRSYPIPKPIYDRL